MGRSDTFPNLGSYEGFTQYVPSHMRPFLFGCHISFCDLIFTQRGEGSLFLGTFENIVMFDLLLFILNNGTVNGEMKS